MKSRYLLVSAILFTVFACSKDSNGGKPQISLVSIGPDNVGREDIFTTDLSYKNDQGYLLDSLYMHMHIINQNQQGLASEFKELQFEVPNYPNEKKGDIQINFARQVGSQYPLWPYDPATNQNDTIVFSFNVMDSKKNMSDTVVANKTIVILNQ